MNSVGAENAWFMFKGKKCAELGVYMRSMPTRPHPARKGELMDIPGRDGKLFFDEGAYDRILVSLRCATRDNASIDAVSAWLTGAGDLVFGDEPNRAYRARITKEFSRSNRNPRLRGQEFTITFDCVPYRYERAPAAPITCASGQKITNPGTVASLPLIKVNGSGDGTLMIGGGTMLFDGLSGAVNVDCDAKIVYTGDGSASSPMLLATQHATGEWLSIPPGDSFVTYTGGITSVVITPRWRWI